MSKKPVVQQVAVVPAVKPRAAESRLTKEEQVSQVLAFAAAHPGYKVWKAVSGASPDTIRMMTGRARTLGGAARKVHRLTKDLIKNAPQPVQHL